MADTVSKTKRSEIMGKIRSRDSQIELNFRKTLWKAGHRYRKNVKNYFGKPDIILPKYKTIIFIDSCFWHGCKKHCRIPTLRKKYWADKIERNKLRDKKVNKFYRKNHWNIFRVWEHDIQKDINNTKEKITLKIKQRNM